VGYGLTSDASGNIHFTGNFSGTADFDPGAGTASLTAGASVLNGYLLQLNNAGNYVSAIAWGGYTNAQLSDQGTSIKADASGNSFVTGHFSGTVDFDPGAGTQNLIAAGSNDIFLAKYDASGNYVWAKSMGGNSGDDQGLSLALDASGNIYITGLFNGTVDFDPDAVGSQPLTSNGSIDMFLAKYDGSGNYIWAKSMGGASNDYAYGLAVDASGNSFITGLYGNTVDFDPGAGLQELTSVQSNDIFIAKYDASGNYVWAKSVGGPLDQRSNAIALDASGNVFITGAFSGTNVDFDPGTDPQYLNAVGGTNDIFVAKYDASGNYVWAKSIGSSTIGNEQATALAVDALGNVYFTGNFVGTSDFDPGASTQNLSSSGTWDIFLAKFDASGNYVWAKKMGGAGDEQATSLALDASGSCYLTGIFNATVDFDPNAGTQNLISAGSADIFLAKYNSSGDYVWAKSMGSISVESANSLAVDAGGNTHITGHYNASVDLDPGAGTHSLTALNPSEFFIAVYSDPTALPIKLESFAGRLIDNDAAVLLQWTTAIEENFAYFEIERSNDGKHLTNLGRVTGCGNCNSGTAYSFTDHQPLTGKAYYRLKLVDKDGRTEYSKWISIFKNESGRSLVIYPTVTNGRVDASYELTGPARKIGINIYDAQGKVIQHSQQVLATGSNQLHFDLSAQAQGLYYIQLAEQYGKVLATGTIIRQ
jgi:hypothetical protein